MRRLGGNFAASMLRLCDKIAAENTPSRNATVTYSRKTARTGSVNGNGPFSKRRCN
jgi:hypothetical protein